MTRGLSFEPWDLWKTAMSFTGPRLRKYLQAYDSLLAEPLMQADARIDAFVKSEKFNPYDKINPDPRMIQARKPRYNLVLASYLRPVEHFIYNLTHRGLPCVAKGKNARVRAQLVMQKMAAFGDPVVVSIDCSRWDLHVSKHVLLSEHMVYKRLLRGHPELDQLLDWQVENHCVTSGGIKYKVVGGRMSGDINTALGNCLLMIMMAKAGLRDMGLTEWDLFDDGDDCLLFLERRDLDRVIAHLPAMFLQFGQEVKIENVAHVYNDVKFCQSQIVLGADGYQFVRDWRKILSQGCCGTKHWANPSEVRPMLGLVGTCELALNRGVPVLQEYAIACLRNADGLRSKLHADLGLAARVSVEARAAGLEASDWLASAKISPISEEARQVFERTFGVPIWEQLEIERILASWTITDVNNYTVPTEWDHRWEDCSSLSVQLPELY